MRGLALGHYEYGAGDFVLTRLEMFKSLRDTKPTTKPKSRR